MKLEEIEDLWSKDCKIDRTNLDNESLKIPELHNKYYKLYIRERIQLKKIESDLSKLEKQKKEYYSGQLSEEELKNEGWEQFNLTILVKEIPLYINADKDIIDLKLKYAIQNEKVSFLKSIIDILNMRSFQIKNAIDFMKFTNGEI